MSIHKLPTANSAVPYGLADCPAGLETGTMVLTMKGAVPVEALQPGDRIVTRSGAMAMRALARIAPDTYRMDFDAPEVVYLENSQIHSDTCTPYLH